MSYFAKRSKRIVAGTLAGALAVTVMPIVGLIGTASAAEALPPLAEPIGAGNFCEGMPNSEPFTDVSDTDPSRDEIVCMVGTDLTNGTTATTYSPNASITRRQMSLFVKREIDLANSLEISTLTDLPTYDGVPDFTDIAGESAETKTAIGQLSQADIVGGFPDGTFRPGGLVSRRQMGAFINRGQDFLTGDPFTTTSDYFNDDNGDTGEDDLNALASVGIFQGDGAGNVNPGGALTRRQMSNVKTRDLQVLFDAGDIERAFGPATNADFPSDLNGPQVVTFDPSGTTGSKATTVTFSGLDDTKLYDIALFPVNDETCCEDSVRQSGTDWVFRDQDGGSPSFDGIADDPCNTSDDNTQIVSVNGQTPDSYCDDLDVSPEAGQFEIRMDNEWSDFNADSLYVAVWASDGDDDLELDASDRPSMPFGVAGPFVWTGGEAPNGSVNSGEYILWIDRDANTVVTTLDYTYKYDSNDVFDYEDTYPVTMTEWESYTSNGDYVYNDDVDGDDIPYNRNPALVVAWSLDDDYAATPANVVATVGDLDTNAADSAANDVRLTWTHDPELGNMEEDDNGDAGFCAYRTTVSSGVYADPVFIDCWNFFDNSAASDAVINNHAVTLIDSAPNGVAGTYAYVVTAVTAIDSEGDYSDPSNTVTTAAATKTSVAGDPTSLSATVQDKDSSSTLTSGDVLTIAFNELMAAPSAGDTITVDDSDTTVADIINGVNSTWTLGPDNGTIIITMTAGPSITTVGAPAGVQFPAVVTATSGVGDSTTDDWSPPTGDTTF